MNKLIIATLAACWAGALVAEEKPAELEEHLNSTCWRVTVGGFGRGNMEAKMRGQGSKDFELYGADLDLQYRVWENRQFNLWAGIGGTFSPRQSVGDMSGGNRSTSSHTVSDDGYVTTDFASTESSRAEMDLGYGEFRLMAVPEWKVTEDFSLGARLGVAFDWLDARMKGRSSWAWNSRIATYIPPYVDDVTTDGDAGSESWFDSETEFAAQAILGLQATYMFTDWAGLYANFDWRLGGETDFDCGPNDKATIDMDGWYWGVGAVFSF